MGKWKMVRLGDVCSGAVTNIAQKDLADNYGDYPIYGASGFIKNVDFYKQDKPYVAVIKDGAGVGRVSRMPAKSSVIGTMQYILPNENVDRNFLYYVMAKLDLARFYTGATIPHIYFKDYKKETIPLPPLPIQQKIADVLDRANALIEKRKAQIDKLDLLVKSQFIEMFGDPMTNPMGWEVKRLGEVFKVTSSKRVYQHEQTTSGVPFLRVSDITNRILNGVDSCSLYISDELFDSYKKAGLVPKANDILVTARGTLGLCYIVKEADRFYFQDGMISWMSKKTEVSADYIMYLFCTEVIRRQIERASAGSTVGYLSLANLENFELMLPPLPLQTQFASFVERVEAQKAKMKQGLELLELEYKSLMQKCFNGELY